MDSRMTVLNLKKSSVQIFKLLSHINEIQLIIATFLKFIISDRGSHCYYSPWAPPPNPPKKTNPTYATACMNIEHSGIFRHVDL
jgi:hypothetical protein